MRVSYNIYNLHTIQTGGSAATAIAHYSQVTIADSILW